MEIKIAVGDSVFVLLTREDEKRRLRLLAVEFEDSPGASKPLQFNPQDVSLPTTRAHSSRTAGDFPSRRANLNALVKISRVVHQIRDLEKIAGANFWIRFLKLRPRNGGAIMQDGQGGNLRPSLRGNRAQRTASHPIRVSPHDRRAKKLWKQGLAGTRHGCSLGVMD